MKNRILVVLFVLLVLALLTLVSCSQECKHECVQNKVEPTCGKEGYVENICIKCGYMYQDQVIPADPSTGHSLVLEDHQLPTCLNEGWEKYICTSCGYTESRYLEALGHSYGEWLVYVDATCTQTGSKIRICSTCGVDEVTELAAKGHALGDWVVTKAPTCTVDGYDTKSCANCDYYETRTTGALGHDYGSWILYRDYSCYSDGKNIRYCSRCANYDYQTLPAAHRWYPESIINDPTCTTEGFTTDLCMVCNYADKHDYVDMIPHDYIGVVTAPTCTEQGYTTYTCSCCPDSYVDDYTDIIPHNFGAWEMYKDSTCTEKGEDRRYCADCDYYESRDIDEHHYETTVVQKTCVSDGFTMHVCKDCGDTYYTDIIQCRGHHVYGNYYYNYDTGLYHKECYYCDHYVVSHYWWD